MLVNIGPILIALLAGVILREGFARYLLAGCAVAFAGTVVIGAAAGRMGSTTYLVPPIAILLGWLLLGETPPGLAVAGGALCFAGVFIARR